MDLNRFKFLNHNKTNLTILNMHIYFNVFVIKCKQPLNATYNVAILLGRIKIFSF